MVDAMGDGGHNAILHENFDQIDRAALHELGEVTHGDGIFHHNRIDHLWLNAHRLFRTAWPSAIGRALVALVFAVLLVARHDLFFKFITIAVARFYFAFCYHLSEPPNSSERVAQ